MIFPPFVSMLSTAPRSRTPDSVSVCINPFLLFRHVFRVAMSLNSVMPLACLLSLSSGGSSPLAAKRSKCSLRMRSMPEGRDGKAPGGRLSFFTYLNQKHFWHSSMRLMEDGDSWKPIRIMAGRLFIGLEGKGKVESTVSH